MVYWILWSIWITFILYQSLIYLGASRSLKKYKAKAGAGDEPLRNRPLPEGVSVLVCAHNELANLRELLPLLYNQNFYPYEIIVVDDRSTDGSLDFLLEQQSQQALLRLVWLRKRPAHIKGKKFALSMGIRAARYDKILLTDADCRPQSPQWVREMSHLLEGNTQFVLGYSPYLYENSWLNAFIRFETLQTALLYLGAALSGRPYMGVGRNLAYRKSFFMQHKGFRGHWHINGGDDDLWVNRYANSKNSAVSLDDRTKVCSVPKRQWHAYFRQKKRHLHVGKYYRRKDKLWLGALSLSEIISWVGIIPLIFLANEPYSIIAGLILKWFALLVAFKTAAGKFNEPINIAQLPILNILYVIYLLVTGTSALFSKNTRWS